MTASVTVIAGPTMEDRAEHVRRARQVIADPSIHTRKVVRDAAAVLRAWGDYTDQVMADAAVYAQDRERWDEIDRCVAAYERANSRLMMWVCITAITLALMAVVGAWGL